VRTQPLAEDDDLGLRVVEDVVEQRGQFVGLVAMVCFVVEQEGAVARHAHVLQGAAHAQLVLLGEKARVPPAVHEACHLGAVFLVMIGLLWSHRYEQGVVDALGQLFEDRRLASPQHDRGQCLANLLQLAVADDAAAFVALLVFVEQAPGRAEAMLVDELDDRDQLLEAVFQRRAGEHQGVGAVDALQRARGDGVPVLDALRLVDDHQVRRPGLDQVEVAAQGFVVGDLAEVVLRVARLADRAQAADDRRLALAEAGDLAFPLVLERSRADHQHALGSEVARENLHRRDGLHGLAEAHLVADQRASGTRGEEGAFALVGIERDLEQGLQCRGVGAGRIDQGECLAARFAVANLGDDRPVRRPGSAGRDRLLRT
jgi:hypothetical protein